VPLLPIYYFVLHGGDLVSRVDMQVGLHFSPSDAHLSEGLFAAGWMLSCGCVQALCATREWAELTFYGLFTAVKRSKVPKTKLVALIERR